MLSKTGKTRCNRFLELNSTLNCNISIPVGLPGHSRISKVIKSSARRCIGGIILSVIAFFYFNPFKIVMQIEVLRKIKLPRRRADRADFNLHGGKGNLI